MSTELDALRADVTTLARKLAEVTHALIIADAALSERLDALELAPSVPAKVVTPEAVRGWFKR